MKKVHTAQIKATPITTFGYSSIYRCNMPASVGLGIFPSGEFTSAATVVKSHEIYME